MNFEKYTTENITRIKELKKTYTGSTK